ncbi:hypothetical protein ACO1O0_003624 [Amphichorda felina]
MELPEDRENDGSLPGILCLHAYGTNAAVLRYQLRHITQALKGVFRFVYVEAPFHVRQPGPGVPPGFSDAHSFRRWHSDKNLAGAFGVPAGDLRDERWQVRELLRETLETERQNAHGPGIVGIMAFSQGAALATALCMDPELGAGIKFAVIICALYPALSLTDEEGEGIVDCAVTKFSATCSSPRTVIDIPSIHVQGALDPWRGQGAKTLGQYFDDGRVRKIQLPDLRHEVPSKVKDAAAIADEVLAVWQSSREEGKT